MIVVEVCVLSRLSDTLMKVLCIIAHIVATACSPYSNAMLCLRCTMMLLAIVHLHETSPTLVLHVECWQPAVVCIASTSQNIECKLTPYAL